MFFLMANAPGVIPAKAGIQSHRGFERLASNLDSPVNPALREGNDRKRDFFMAHFYRSWITVLSIDPADNLMETLFIDARVNREDIVYVSHTIESYEGMATVSTTDPAEGLIRITLSPFFLKEVKTILRELKKEVSLELLNEHGG
jgi:hypothetical protein